MFDTLIESTHKAKRSQLFGTGLLSLLLHTVLITGVVYATLQAGQTDNSKPVETRVEYFSPPQQRPDQPLPQVDLLPNGFRTVVAVIDIPTSIPPVDLNNKINPADFKGVGAEGGSANGILPASGEVMTPDLVQEKPELLSHPPLVYPEMLKQAGIEGTVIVQAVVDSTGRIELSSIRIVESPNPGFDQSARSLVLKSLYRPARVYGRAVRVLIQQPIAFTIRHDR
jgi:periplasmic protein TonB